MGWVDMWQPGPGQAWGLGLPVSQRNPDIADHMFSGPEGCLLPRHPWRLLEGKENPLIFFLVICQFCSCNLPVLVSESQLLASRYDI